MLLHSTQEYFFYFRFGTTVSPIARRGDRAIRARVEPTALARHRRARLLQRLRAALPRAPRAPRARQDPPRPPRPPRRARLRGGRLPRSHGE